MGKEIPRIYFWIYIILMQHNLEVKTNIDGGGCRIKLFPLKIGGVATFLSIT